MNVTEVRSLPHPPLMHDEGGGWTRLDTGESGLLAMFNLSDDGKKPSLHIGIEGVVDETGKPVQVLRYDPHEGDAHMHWFANGVEVRAPFFVKGDDGRISALLGMFDEPDCGIRRDLVAVGHEATARKLVPRDSNRIASQLDTLV